MKDEIDIQAILFTLQQFDVKLFSNNSTELINIATGVSPDAETSWSIVTAMAQGAETTQKFIQDRLLNAIKPFYTAIYRLKIPSFDFVAKSLQPAIKPNVPKISFAKLLISAKSREVDLHTVLEKEIGPIPLALFTENGQKTCKSQLMHILEQKYLGNMVSNDDSQLSTNKLIIINGMCILHSTKTSGTFYNYALKMLEIFLECGKGYTRVDVVLDVYSETSIKAQERIRRGAQ